MTLYVLGLFVLLLFGGVGAFQARPFHARLLWGAFAVIATILLMVEASRWAQALSWVLLFATSNASSSIFTGHIINMPEQPISRMNALALTLVLAAMTALSFTFLKRKLNRVDRIALLIVLASIAFFPWAATYEWVLYVVSGSSLCSLLVAWAYNRIRRRGHHHQSALVSHNDQLSSIRQGPSE